MLEAEVHIQHEHIQMMNPAFEIKQTRKKFGLDFYQQTCLNINKN